MKLLLLVDECLWLCAIFIIFTRCFSSSEVVGSSSPQVPSMFVFGDSLVDHGNNNYLSSYAKSNYIPYGIDFYKGPTGRFSNGKTTIDLIGEEFGLPYLPAYEDALAVDTILHGVNYASAAGGILNLTGQFLVFTPPSPSSVDRFSFSQQVAKFKSTVDLLRNHMGEKNLSQYLAKSIAIINIGSNDYINNYLLPYLYPTSYYHTPVDYANLLIDLYASHLQALYNAGLRKFVLGGVGPLGCIPNQLATGMALPGRCVAHVNDMVGLFNDRLRSLVDKMNANHTDAIFVYGNTYGAFGDILNNPSAYGFKVTDAGCCGIGRNQGQITCLPYSFPCMNRSEYVFWDAFHPTEAVNAIIAQRAISGSPSDCYPINLKQMAQI